MQLIIRMGTIYSKRMPDHAINSDVQKRRFALLLHAGYGERSKPDRRRLSEN